MARETAGTGAGAGATAPSDAAAGVGREGRVGPRASADLQRILRATTLILFPPTFTRKPTSSFRHRTRLALLFNAARVRRSTHPSRSLPLKPRLISHAQNRHQPCCYGRAVSPQVEVVSCRECTTGDGTGFPQSVFSFHRFPFFLGLRE